MSEKQSKMTPGPWRQQEDDEWLVFAINPTTGEQVCIADCAAGADTMGYDEAIANARAIAALPELIQAARAVVTTSIGNPRNRDNVESLRAILDRIDR